MSETAEVMENEVKEKLERFFVDKNLKEFFKESDNMVLVTFGYNHSFILPHDDAVKIIAAMRKAEPVNTGYSHKFKFDNDIVNKLEMTLIDPKEYRRAKISHYLKLDVDVVNTYLNKEEIPF